MPENVAEELQQMRRNDETKWIMLDILKRFHSENEAWMRMVCSLYGMFPLFFFFFFFETVGLSLIVR